jgi:hypothetical protein
MPPYGLAASLFRLFSPFSRGGGWGGREKRAGVMRVLGGGNAEVLRYAESRRGASSGFRLAVDSLFPASRD